MIRHRPRGSGHPYAADTEQRDPIVPVAGEALRLGVKASSDVVAVTVEILTLAPGGNDWKQAISEVISLQPVPRTERGQITDGGHLASAQAKLARAAGGWQATVSAPELGSRLRYRFHGERADGTTESTRTFEASVAGWVAAPDGVVNVDGQQRVIPGSVWVLHDGTRASRVRFALPLAAGERIAGFGERFDRIDHRGQRLDAVVFEQYKSQGAHGRTYMPMPFAHVAGGEGWGFHLRTSRRSWYDLGASNEHRIAVEVEVDARRELQCAADGTVSSTGLVDLAVYSGSPAEVLSQFLAEVGRPKQLPDWVFRLWGSGNEWNTQAEVMRQVALHKEHDIPVGSIVIEAWSDEATFTAFRDAEYSVNEDGAPHRLADFTFPADGAWPDPKGMVDALHADDVKVLLWQIPLLKMRPHPNGQAKANAQAAVAEGVLIQEPGADGKLRPYRNRGWWFPLALMPDLSDARAAKWWVEQRRYLVEEVGIDGFKTDGGEHAWGGELQYLDGRDGDERNNLFPVDYARVYGELLESAGKAPVTFSRAGFTGSQAHGAFWAGDENSTWEAFRWSMLAGLSAAASGILYWGWDLAGFSGDIPDAELYLRATAASAFVPIMQYHSEFNHHRTPSRDRTPWNIAERTGDASVLPVFRKFTKLREALVPYLSQQAEASIANDLPLMRPLWMQHPDVAEAWDGPISWLLGEDILVSPVLEAGAQSWQTWLPAGDWIDAWTGEKVPGDGVHQRAVPIDEVPVYVRAAAWSGLSQAFSSVSS